MSAGQQLPLAPILDCDEQKERAFGPLGRHFFRVHTEFPMGAPSEIAPRRKVHSVLSYLSPSFDAPADDLRLAYGAP